ncbi:MAG: GAF domain-containing protein, partial [Chloroflexota bacterium]
LQVSESPQDLLRSIHRQLLHLLDAENMIVTLNPDHTGNSDLLLHTRQGRRLHKITPADEFLISKISKNRLHILIEQNVDAYMRRQGGEAHEQTVTSWLGMPMIVRQQAIGVIAVYAVDNRVFSAADTRRLRIVATTLASALENARLYQQQEARVARLNTLNTVSTLLSSTLSPENVLDTIVTSAAMLAESDAVAVYLLENRQTAEGNGPVLMRSAGLSAKFIDSPPPLLLANQIHSTPEDTTIPEQQLRIVYDVLTDADTTNRAALFADEGIRTLVELPLIINSKLAGAIVLYYHAPRTFNAEMIEFMRTFAGEVVQAIKNAELYARTDEALEQRLIQLSILAAVGQHTNASIDVQTISDVILTFAIDYTEAPHGLILLRNPPTRTAMIAAYHGYSSEQIKRDRLAEHLIDGLQVPGQYLRVREGDELAPAQRIVPSTQSQLVVPILRDRDLLGALIMESDRHGHFDSEAISFITQLLNQAAIAIDNRNLFQTVTQSRDRLQVILDAMSEAVMLVNTQGRVELANPAVALIGMDHMAITQRPVAELIGDQPRATGFASVAELDNIMSGLASKDAIPPEPQRYVIQGEKEQDTVFIERHIVPLRNDNGELAGLLLVFYDQTRQVQLDNTRDEITRMIVHDLRSPLTAIKTSIHLINQLVPEHIEHRSKLDEVTGRNKNAVNKMLHRINSLLDVARIESGEMQLERRPLTILESIQAVFTELQPIADEQQVRLKQQVMTDNLPQVEADSDKIERVLLNLVDNALKYTDSGTEIVVRVHGRGIPPPARVHISVRDHGPGVPEAYRERLFDRFVQVEGRDSVRGGVGLGLTFCRMVVEAHGGTIQVENHPEGGAVFSFTLPVASEITTRNSAR